MEEKIRHKSWNGKRFEISVKPFGDLGMFSRTGFVARNIDKPESLALDVQVSRSTAVITTGMHLKDERLSTFLRKQGLALVKDRIEKGIMENKEITLTAEDMKEIDNLNKPNSGEQFKLRLRIKKDILEYLYSKREATYKELVDYVWCKNKLLEEEIQSLTQRKLINSPQYMSELRSGGKVVLTEEGKHEYEQIMEKDIIQKNTELKLFKDWVPFASNKKVFLAHRFEETILVKQIKDKLIQGGFTPIEGKMEDLAPITEGILKKIQSSGFFLALITPYKEFKDETFSTSSWILMEIGAAIAYGRIVLVLAEDCVEQKEYAKKLQPDGQYEIFNREKDFKDKLELAVGRIKKE
jgi:hypothetical protein